MTEQENEIEVLTDEVKDVNGVDAAQLLNYIKRVEWLEDGKRTLSHDIKEVFEEAESAGYDVLGLKEILKRRKKDENDVAELDFIVEKYKIALGMG